jgi:effector-binding domain-containing protein
MKRLLFLYAGLTLAVLLLAFTGELKQDRLGLYVAPKITDVIKDTIIPVKVQLEKTSIKTMFILFVKDTAETNESLKDIFGKDYGELMQCINQNKLHPLKFMAWYYSVQPPWIIDVAVETSTMPAQLSGRIMSREQEGGDVVIAHVWGPYDQVGQAYMQIEKWLKENNRKAKANPFEVYLNDPSMVKDASEIQTDIYQPIE